MSDARRPGPAMFALRALLLLTAVSLPRTLEAAAAPGCGVSTRAERWVLKQVTAGNTANLKEEFPEERFPESARTIRACFLKGLLVNSDDRPNIRDFGVHVVGAVVPDAFNVSNANIPYALTIESFHFKDAVRFENALVGGDFSADGSHFYGGAYFEGVRVEGDAFFRGAVFDDDAVFVAAHTKGNFEANGAEFKHTEKAPQFYNLTVERSAFFIKTVFRGPVNFTNADVDQDFEASGAAFTSPKESATFYSAKVGRDMVFRELKEGEGVTRKTVFEGPADFRNLNVTKDLDASAALFNNKEAGVDFFSAKIGGNAFFWDVVFAGGVNFIKADVGGNIEFIRVRAANPAWYKDFNGMKADVFLVEDSELSKPYRLHAMSYRIISGGSTRELLRFIEDAEYGPDSGPDVYVNLENYFQRSGHLDAAKQVHVARKWREGSGIAFRRPLAYLWNWVEYLSSGYGQYLVTSLVWSLILVVFGAFVFRREEYMETQDLGDAARYAGRYHPLWYSLALFLPIVDLPDAKTWTPKMEHRKRRLYMRLHIIFGYLLIPVALAAWTGIIK